jgi:hypothetical protein
VLPSCAYEDRRHDGQAANEGVAFGWVVDFLEAAKWSGWWNCLAFCLRYLAYVVVLEEAQISVDFRSRHASMA